MYEIGLAFGIFSPFVIMIIAFFLGTFTTSQMRQRGINDGLPYTRHLGAWGEQFILPFGLGTMAAYALQWSWMAVGIASVIGIVVSVAMHVSWVKGSKRQEHMLSPKGLNLCGHIHIIYFTAVFAELVLFYLACSPTMHDKVLVAVIFGVNTLIGTQGVNLMKDGTIDTPGVIVTLSTWAVLAAAVLFGRQLL